MSRRAITKAVKSLRNEIVNDIEAIITREMGRLEIATSTPTSAPMSTDAQPAGPALAPATEKADDQPGVLISQAAGRQIYQLVELTEDLIALGRAGKARAFDAKAENTEELITRLDNELLSQVDLTGQTATN